MRDSVHQDSPGRRLADRLRHAIRVTSLLLGIASAIGLVSSHRAFGQSGAAAPQTSHDQILAHIIEQVRRNERVYEDIEVRWKTTYDQNDKVIEGLTKQSTSRWVRQNGLHFFERQGTEQWARQDASRRTIPNPSTAFKDLRVFDGETTWVLRKENTTAGTQADRVTGSISPGYLNHSGLLNPHMMLLGRSHSDVPLSTYLQGTAAIRAHALESLDERTDVRAKFVGIDVLDGLTCYKVQVLESNTMLESGSLRAIWEFWLAEECNYLPVRLLCFEPDYSDTEPTSEGRVSDLHEISPEVWFPFAAETTKHDVQAVLEDGSAAWRWREKLQVQQASLSPDYPQSLFTAVTFPEGTVIEDHRPRSPEKQEPALSPYVLPVITWTLLFTVIAWQGLRRTRRSLASRRTVRPDPHSPM